MAITPKQIPDWLLKSLRTLVFTAEVDPNTMITGDDNLFYWREILQHVAFLEQRNTELEGALSTGIEVIQAVPAAKIFPSQTSSKYWDKEEVVTQLIEILKRKGLSDGTENQD